MTHRIAALLPQTPVLNLPYKRIGKLLMREVCWIAASSTVLLQFHPPNTPCVSPLVYNTTFNHMILVSKVMMHGLNLIGYDYEETGAGKMLQRYSLVALEGLQRLQSYVALTNFVMGTMRNDVDQINLGLYLGVSQAGELYLRN
jgi:hypothetical protein